MFTSSTYPKLLLREGESKSKDPKKTKKGKANRRGKKRMMMNNRMKFLPLGELEAKLL